MNSNILRTNEISLESFIQFYDASYHPEVRDGSLTETQLLRSIVNGFGERKDMITRDDFFDFVGNLSVFVMDDIEFEEIMKGSVIFY